MAKKQPQLLIQANRCLKSGDLEKARSLYRECLAKWPDHPDVLNAVGILAYRDGAWDKAAGYFSQAVARQQDNPIFRANLGKAYQSQGQVEKSIVQFEQALKLSPKQVDIWAQLGSAHRQLGRTEPALKCFLNALKLQPSQWEWHYQVGVMFQKLGQFKQAVQHYQAVLKLKPDMAETYCNLSLALCGLGQFEKAIGFCQEALRIKPDMAEAHLNLGLIWLSQNKLADASHACEKAIIHQPNFPKAYLTLGKIRHEQGRYTQAISLYERVLQLEPDWAEAHFCMAYSLHILGRLGKAVPHYRKAIVLNPRMAEAYNNLGNIIKGQGNLAEAKELYEKALEINPNYASALNNLGLIYHLQFEVEQAAPYFQRALELNPNMYEAHDNLADALIHMGKVQEAITEYETSYRLKPRDGVRIRMATSIPFIYHDHEDLRYWRTRFAQNIQRLHHIPLALENPVTEAGIPTFILAYHGLDNKSLQQDVSALFRSPRNQTYAPLPDNKKPKVGFISRYFNPDHTIAKVFLGLIEQLSREKFDVVVLCVGYQPPLSIKTPYQHINLPLFDLARARTMVAEQKLDLLCYTDIGMDPLTYHLAFNRLAPVQCVTWGHPDTTGIETLDYYLSSALFETEASQDRYTEQLVALETIPTYFYRPDHQPGKHTREHFGIKPNEHLYLCPQSLFKFHPDFDDLLAEILRRDPRGVLLLANIAYKSWTDILLKRFADSMPDVVDRIRILDKMPHAEFLDLLSVADVMLDTLHFGGGRSTYEAMTFGTPIITLPTDHMRGRMTYGCYQKMGVMDCVAQDAGHYVELATRLAGDPDYRQALRAKLLAANDVLYQDMAAVQGFEDFFLQAIQQVQDQKRGLAVTGLSVS